MVSKGKKYHASVLEWQERNESERKLNAEKLNQAVTAAIESSGLESSPYLVQEVSKRFEIKDGKLQPTSLFKNMDEFLENYKIRIQKDAAGNAVELSVKDRIEAKAMEKKQKFEEMIYFSRSGQQNEYRKAHAEWQAM